MGTGFFISFISFTNFKRNTPAIIIQHTYLKFYKCLKKSIFFNLEMNLSYKFMKNLIICYKNKF